MWCFGDFSSIYSGKWESCAYFDSSKGSFSSSVSNAANIFMSSCSKKEIVGGKEGDETEWHSKTGG